MPPASAKLNEGLTDTWGRRNRKLADKTCPHCGASFKPHRATSTFCSRPCARTKNGGQNKKPETWWVSQKGYINGRVWEGDQQRNVKKHRLIMERHLGRKLLPDEDVHHIDGDKQNNAIENLQVVNHGDHSRITNSGRTYRRGYKLDLSEAERAARSERMRLRRNAALRAASPESGGA